MPPAIKDRAAPAPRAPGSHVLDRYRLDSLLGTGATAEVWRAVDIDAGAPVTLKLLRDHLSDDPRAQASFRAEARLLAKMPARSVVPVRTFHDGSVGWAIVFEDVPGETLAQRISRGPLAPEDASDIAARLARSLSRAHAMGLVHRDVKPGNILLAADGTVRLLDFGIARELDRDEGPHTTTGMVVGTLPYLSPERLRGAAASPATDVYALGVVLHEMLAGPRPDGSNGSHDDVGNDLLGPIDGVPVALVAICHAMVLPDPHRRLADAASVAEALDRWMAEGTMPAAIGALATDADDATTTVASPMSGTGTAGPWSRRAPMLGGIAAAGIAVAVVASSVGMPNLGGLSRVDMTATPPSAAPDRGSGAEERGAGAEPVQQTAVRPPSDDGGPGDPTPGVSSGPGPGGGDHGNDNASGKDKDKDKGKGKDKKDKKDKKEKGRGGGGGGDDDDEGGRGRGGDD